MSHKVLISFPKDKLDIFGNLRPKVSFLLKLGRCKPGYNIVNEKKLFLQERKDA